MSALVRSLAAMLLALVAASAAAQGARRTGELMRLSGLDDQISRVQGEIGRKNAESLELRPDDRARIGEIMKAAFAPQKMRAVVDQELRKLLTPEVENAAIGWLSGDLGRRIRAMEARVEAEGPMLKHPALAKSYLSTADSQRRELYKRLATSMRYADAQADILFNMFAAISVAANAMTSGRQEHNFIRARSALAGAREEIVNRLREQSMAAFAYTYRDLTEEELTRYAEFAESPAGLRYNDAIVKAAGTAITASANEMARNIAEDYERRRAAASAGVR